MKKEFLNTSNLYLILLHIIIIGMGVELYILVNQNAELKNRSNGMKEQRKMSIGDTLRTGVTTAIANSDGVRMSGPRLVYFFTTKCPFCKKNIRYWNRLNDQWKNSNIQVVGYSLDDRDKTTEMVLNDSIQFPVYGIDDLEFFRRNNKVDGVPVTALVDSTDKVLMVWQGAFQDSSLSEIVATISEFNKSIIKN